MASIVSVTLYVRYVFPYYTQMVVGLVVIHPVRTHVTAPMDTLVTKLRENVLTAVMMETRMIPGGVGHGMALDVSLVSYKTGAGICLMTIWILTSIISLIASVRKLHFNIHVIQHFRYREMADILARAFLFWFFRYENFAYVKTSRKSWQAQE